MGGGTPGSSFEGGSRYVEEASLVPPAQHTDKHFSIYDGGKRTARRLRRSTLPCGVPVVFFASNEEASSEKDFT